MEQSREQLKTYFETGDIPKQVEFEELIDSQLNKLDDGFTVTDSPDGTNYIGIENRFTTARLNVMGDMSSNIVSLYGNLESRNFYLMKESRAGETADPTQHVRVSHAYESSYFEAPSREHAYLAEYFSNISGLHFISRDLHQTESKSLLYLQQDGNIGVGTTMAQRKIDIQEGTPGNITGIRISNSATIANYGWSVGHFQSGSPEVMDGAFIIGEENSSMANATQRLTINPGGNVGINETLPDTRLHISRALSDFNTPIDLRSGTGIVMVGPMEEHMVHDTSGLQARRGTITEGLTTLEANTMSLQPMGGAVLIHGDDSIPASHRAIITEEGALGIGTTSPSERVDIDGAIKLGTGSNTNTAGTIRFTGERFEGHNGTDWRALQSQWLEASPGSISYVSDITKVGIGVSDPLSTLHVLNEVTTEDPSSTSLYIQHRPTGSSKNIAMVVDCDPAPNEVSMNIGILVSSVTGNPWSQHNIAAALNGNVLIGQADASLGLIRPQASHVLAIQSGMPPMPAESSEAFVGYDQIPVPSINIYATQHNNIDVFHVMDGMGNVVKLFKADPIIPDNGMTPGSTYGENEQWIITNLSHRVMELEARLIEFGLLGTF